VVENNEPLAKDIDEMIMTGMMNLDKTETIIAARAGSTNTTENAKRVTVRDMGMEMAEDMIKITGTGIKDLLFYKPTSKHTQ
jgi:hypothetical protein